MHKRLLILLALCGMAFGQGLTLKNPVFVASLKTPAAAGGGGGGTIGPISITSNDDDKSFFFFDGNWNIQNDGTLIGGEVGTLECWITLRFTLSAAVPDNATVAAGTKVEIWGEGVDGWVSGNGDFLEILGEDSADAPQHNVVGERPNHGASPGSVALTTAAVRWPAAGGLTWNTGSYNEREVISIIQELVDDNNGLASGVQVTLWIWGTAVSSANGLVEGEASEGAGTNPPRLTIVYE